MPAKRPIGARRLFAQGIEADILLALAKRLQQWNARSVPHPGFFAAEPQKNAPKFQMMNGFFSRLSYRQGPSS
jgi:hypothetical protein